MKSPRHTAGNRQHVEHNAQRTGDSAEEGTSQIKKPTHWSAFSVDDNG